MSLLRNYPTGENYTLEFTESSKPDFVYKKVHQTCLTRDMRLAGIFSHSPLKYGADPGIVAILEPIPQII